MSQSRAEEATSSASSTTEANVEQNPTPSNDMNEKSNEPIVNISLSIRGPLSKVIDALLEKVAELKSLQVKLTAIEEIVSLASMLHTLQQITQDIEEATTEKSHEQEESAKNDCDAEEKTTEESSEQNSEKSTEEKNAADNDEKAVASDDSNIEEALAADRNRIMNLFSLFSRFRQNQDSTPVNDEAKENDNTEAQAPKLN